MATLLSLMLVTKSSGPSSLLICVPDKPEPIPRTTRPIYTHARKTRHRHRSHQNHYSDSDPPSDDEQFYRSTETENGAYYLNLPTDLLAARLCPEEAMCDQKYEMVINHLSFVGHPVIMRRRKKERKRTENSWRRVTDSLERRGRTRTPARIVEESSSSSPHREYPRPIRNNTVSSSPRTLDLPRVETFETFDDKEPSPPPPITPIASPLKRDIVELPDEESSLEETAEDEMENQLISMFNLVLVIDTPPDSDLSEHLDAYHRDIILPITAALKKEERVSKYLSEEKVAIQKEREAMADQGLPHSFSMSHSHNPLVRALIDVYIGIKNSTTPIISFRHLDLSVVLHEASSHRPNVVSEWSRHSVWGTLVAGAVEGEEELSKSMDIAMAFDRVKEEAEEWASFRPWNRWQTLLPLVDVEEMGKLTRDETLGAFVELISPNLTFVEYATLLNISPESMKKIVEHMIKWKKGRVIEVISFKNTYLVNPKLDMRSIATSMAHYAIKFPTLPPLPTLLSSLSPPRPFSQTIPPAASDTSYNDHRSLYLDVLTWLLQKEFVVQAHYYMRLVARPEIKRRARDRHSKTKKRRPNLGVGEALGLLPASPADSGMMLPRTKSASSITSSPAQGLQPTSSLKDFSPSVSPAQIRSSSPAFDGSNLSESDWEEDMRWLSEDVDTPSIIPEPARLTRVERRWLEEIYTEKRSDVAILLKKVIHLCNGRHGDYEIMQRTGLSRKEMRIIWKECSDDLVISLCIP